MIDEDTKIHILLKEYETAQDSAQYHDSLAWNITGIVIGGMFVLLGFAITHLLTMVYLGIAVCLFAIMLLLSLALYYLHYADIRNQKYNRCKRLEELINRHMQSIVKISQHSDLNYPEGFMRQSFPLMMLLMILVWLIVLTEISTIAGVLATFMLAGILWVYHPLFLNYITKDLK